MYNILNKPEKALVLLVIEIKLYKIIKLLMTPAHACLMTFYAISLDIKR